MTRATLLLAVALSSCVANAGSTGLAAPRFDEAFWKHWSDGRAELAGYQLTYPRYGALRSGIAVTIFVNETFSEAARVKADPGKHPPSDEYPVMKLNLVKDFPTGIYDYNTMTSSWVTLAPRHARSAGSATKVSFSSQEWCGHVYQQLLFDPERVREEVHSYFDGEADGERTLEHPRDGVAADLLFFWARGLAAPLLAPGETREVSLLSSLEHARMKHVPVAWARAKLSRRAAPEKLSVPAGTFEADVYEASAPGLPTLTFHVERGGARRILRWTTSEGERAELLASTRRDYWKANGVGMESALAELGLTRRGALMP